MLVGPQEHLALAESENDSVRLLEVPAEMAFTFYGRVGSTRLQDPQASYDWQITRARQLIEPKGGVIVAEYFDIGHSRALPWQRRPQGNQLLAALRDPGRGFNAVVIGEGPDGISKASSAGRPVGRVVIRHPAWRGTLRHRFGRRALPRSRPQAARPLVSNGDVDVCWRFHLAQEHHASHQAGYQAPLAFAA